MTFLKYTPLLLLLLLKLEIKAQNQLSIDTAIALVLKNNYGILVANNSVAIAKANNTAGNAGMLPTVTATAGNNYSNNSINQKLANGNEIINPHATSNAISGSVALNWTVFDGCKMFVSKKKLAETEAQSQLQYKNMVLQSVATVIASYYSIVKQKQQLIATQEAINYNNERVTILQAAVTSGLSAKNGLLQAQIDLNVFRENAIVQQTEIENAKHSLNLLLARDASTAFEVSDSISIKQLPKRDEIEQKLYVNNPLLLAYQRQINISKLSVTEYKALRSIKLNLNAAYNYLQTENSAGNLLRNNSLGPTIGASLAIPLFQSGNISRQITVAKLQLSSDTFAYENLKLQLNTQLQNALTSYETQLQLLDIELKNNVLAKENINICLQRLKYGQSTALETRLAQQEFADSNTRLINYRYALKIAETTVQQLLNQL